MYLNDKKIGYCDNIYRTYYFLMTSAVEGTNRLRIDIESTIRYAYANGANYTKDVAEDYFWENEWITQAEVE